MSKDNSLDGCIGCGAVLACGFIASAVIGPTGLPAWVKVLLVFAAIGYVIYWLDHAEMPSGSDDDNFMEGGDPSD